MVLVSGPVAAAGEAAPTSEPTTSATEPRTPTTRRVVLMTLVSGADRLGLSPSGPIWIGCRAVLSLCQTRVVAVTETVGTAPRANLADHVRASAARRGDADALDAAVDALASRLGPDLRLQPGDRVALALSNTPAFVTAYFAVLRAGLVAVPVNTGYTGHEMGRLVGDADAKAVFCEESTQQAAELAVASTHRALVDPAGLDALVGAGRGSGPV